MSWSIEHSRALYHTDTWSEGYVDINANGNVTIKPTRNNKHIDLLDLSQQLKKKGLSFPILVRFTDILKDRVATLIHAFDSAMQSANYTAGYTTVYPIKVNQQRRVIEDIVSAGSGKVGLEAGSKPELLIVIALAKQGSTIICNGYKDREYIRLALIAKQLNFKTFIVIEKLSEIDLIIECANELKVQPLLGIRVRLSSMATGNWQNTGGEKSKFGLHTNEMITAVEMLKNHKLIDALELLHFHIGSQVSALNDFKTGLNEGARYYAHLKKMSVPIKTVDVGGGLGVDYEGTQSDRLYSMDYTISSYAETVINTIQAVCAAEKVELPDIITESGRAMTAHHAMLITNIIDVEEPITFQLDKNNENHVGIIQQLYLLFKNCTADNIDTSYIKCNDDYATARQQFINGELDLEQWALVEGLYYATCQKCLRLSDNHSTDVLDSLREKLADKYFCNFSLFQTMPDSWAIDQIFPVLPLQRLAEEPDRRCTIQDLTCDSDGRIDHYVDGEGVETSLPIHSLHKDEEYLIGFFLLGAYQEILGDIHNLFGDPASANVELDANGSITLSEIDFGDSVSDLFQTIHIDLEKLKAQYRAHIEKTDIDKQYKKDYLKHLVDGLDGYTYLEDFTQKRQGCNTKKS